MYLLAVIILPCIGLICFGLYICWILGQEEVPSIFVMDEKQKIEHDKNREGISQ